MNGVEWKRAGRVFLLAMVIMVAAAFFALISVARSLSVMAAGTAQFAPLGVPVFVGTKNGFVSTLQPRIGLILVLAIPLLLAAVTLVLSRWRRSPLK